ncbi:hypothetical protein CXT99_01695 [Akkermansia muciniphila]|jgi:hypothetical protein|nr:hypothetical protein CXU00_02270 [Akkermansia muciniphila]PNC68524.1 hypothetical protein CXT99_01695 [Akkermansia muciniphila]QAT90820.1 hypothetical protein AKKM5201_02090 [Akkermansia muciniphila]DAN16111.1 MAG TPA: hypothetical protein [Caudoviricetes sp.]
MFGGISWSNIIEGICITVGSTVALTLLYRFRKIIAAWLKRRFNRLCRFMKISQCFPRHTFEFRRLIRQNCQLTRANNRLRVELGKIDLQEIQRDKQLREAQEKLLIFAAELQEWSWEDVSMEFQWSLAFTQFVVDACMRDNMVEGSSWFDAFENRNSFSITHKGRSYLFSKGLLSID